jgi:hypothetical protein
MNKNNNTLTCPYSDAELNELLHSEAFYEENINETLDYLNLQMEEI